MQVPHRDYSQVVPAFREALDGDPDFISKACVHICTGGSAIRDQQDAAIITLLQSNLPGLLATYREAGRCLLLGGDTYNIEPDGIRGLPPFRIFRVDKFVRQSDRKAPRLMGSVMRDYVEVLESNPLRFDGVVLRSRRALKFIYTHYHLRPSTRAQAILFDNAPPADSKLAILKLIAQTDNPREQARLVIENKIPYVVASSVLPKITPAVGVALIDVMSPTEALNSRRWVESSGLLEIPEVRDAYTAKVAKATASVASADFRVSAQGTDQGVQAAVQKAQEKSIKQSKKIERDTLVLVDRSSSMESAISVAQQFGSRIAPLCEGDLMVVAFNDYAQEIMVAGNTLQDWRRAFAGIRAGGWTSMEAGLALALKGGFMPQQIIVITDGGENRGEFTRSLRAIEDQQPHIVVIHISPVSTYYQGGDVFSKKIENAGYRLDKFEIDGANPDYYIFDQVAALLGGPPALSLIEQILAVELPRRV